MEDGCATLEKRAKEETQKEPACWKGFDKPTKKIYVPVSRPGWYTLGINGGGAIDLVDYKTEEEN